MAIAAMAFAQTIMFTLQRVYPRLHRPPSSSFIFFAVEHLDLNFRPCSQEAA